MVRHLSFGYTKRLYGSRPSLDPVTGFQSAFQPAHRPLFLARQTPAVSAAERATGGHTITVLASSIAGTNQVDTRRCRALCIQSTVVHSLWSARRSSGFGNPCPLATLRSSFQHLPIYSIVSRNLQKYTVFLYMCTANVIGHKEVHNNKTKWRQIDVTTGHRPSLLTTD